MLAGRVGAFRRCKFGGPKRAENVQIFQQQVEIQEEGVELRSELFAKLRNSKILRSYDQNKFAFVSFKELAKTHVFLK